MEQLVVRGRFRRWSDDVLALAIPLTAVSSWVLGRTVGIGFTVAVAAAFIVQTALRYTSRIVLANDGLRVDGVFVSYPQIARVDPAVRDVRVTLADGKTKTLVLASRKDSARVLDALRGHIERATADRDALRGNFTALEVTPERWAARLRGGGGVAYREGDANAELLVRVLSSPAASPLARVGAAVRLRELGADMGPVRDAAATYAHPKVREVLESLVANDAARAASVLDTWEDPSASPSPNVDARRAGDGGDSEAEAEVLEPNRLLQRAVWAMRAWPLFLAVGAVTHVVPMLIAGTALAMTAGLARAWLSDKNPSSRKRRAKVRVTPEGLDVEGLGVLDPKRHRVFLRFESGMAPVLHFETPGRWHVLEVRGHTEDVTRGWMNALGADAGQKAVDFKTLVPGRVFQMVTQVGGMTLTGIAGGLALRAGLPSATVLCIGLALMMQVAFWQRTVDVRPEGVELKTFGKPRFIPWADVASVDRGIKGGALVLAGGERVPLRSVTDDSPATHEQRSDFLVERAYDALLAYRLRADVRVRVEAKRETEDVEVLAEEEDESLEPKKKLPRRLE